MKTLGLETINDVDYLTVDGEVTSIFFDETEASELRAKAPSLWLAHLLRTLAGERLEILKNVATDSKRGAITKAKALIQEQLEKAKREFEELGGLAAASLPWRQLLSKRESKRPADCAREMRPRN
jgi:hypothetical protein